MELVIREGTDRRAVDASGCSNVLEALRAGGCVIDAPCGGGGTCGKCRVLVRDSEGLSYRLACMTDVQDGMEVTVERPRAMKVSTGGFATHWQPDAEEGWGAAIDVGTTTVVCRLYRLGKGGEQFGPLSVGRSNPQLAFGADVLSRISAVGDGGLDAMCDLLGDSLVDMLRQLAKEAGVRPADVSRVVLAGNTTMEHIAARLDPTSIGSSPFTPLSLFGDEVRMGALERLKVAQGDVFFAPCVAGYVGGDITCGMLAIDLLHEPDPVVFLDLGTNGEMALGDERGAIACATAAGPVFEGANIKYGMPAYPGAISQVRFADGELAIDTIGGGTPMGVCGTGLIDAVALMVEYGLIDEGGLILDDDEIDVGQSLGLERWLCEEDGQMALRLADGIAVTQADVRALQLAKAAVCAGILTMLHERGISLDDVGKLAIAGGFGEYLDLEHAARIGLFPRALLSCATSIGNSSIEGAGAVLTSSAARVELEDIAGRCDYVELSGHAKFNELYVDAMMFDEAIA